MLTEILVLLGWLAGLVVAVVLFGFVWWGLFGDRDSHRRRCPACWHDLSETPGFTCGECGFEAADESHFHRRRRRLGVAAVACLALVAGIAAAHWHFGSTGWARPIPTRALIAVLPLSNGSSGDVYAELLRRARSGDLGEHHFEAIFGRLERGDGGAPPASPAWIERYGPYVEWWRRVGFGSEDQRRRLAELPAALTAIPPAHVLAGAPSAMHLRLEHWWPPEYECRVRVTSALDGFMPIVAARSANDPRAPVLPVVLPPLSPDLESIELVVEVERRIAPDAAVTGTSGAGASGGQADQPWSLVERRMIALPVNRRAGEIEFIPVDTPTMSAAISQTFGHGMRRWPAGVRRFGVQFAPQMPDPMEFTDVAIGVRVEVLENGIPRRETRVWWMNGGGDPPEAAWEIVHEDAAALDRAVDGDPAWSLRITGDPVVAARAAIFRVRGSGPEAPGADSGSEEPLRYWSGSIELPLIVREHSGTAPLRRWQIDVEAVR